MWRRHFQRTQFNSGNRDAKRSGNSITVKVHKVQKWSNSKDKWQKSTKRGQRKISQYMRQNERKTDNIERYQGEMLCVWFRKPYITNIKNINVKYRIFYPFYRSRLKINWNIHTKEDTMKAYKTMLMLP